MAEHAPVRTRVDNVVFVPFRRRGAAGASPAVAAAAGRTCRSCAHWCGEGTAGSGCCLADCGLRPTAADGRCGEWRRPPLLTVV